MQDVCVRGPRPPFVFRQTPAKRLRCGLSWRCGGGLSCARSGRVPRGARLLVRYCLSLVAGKYEGRPRSGEPRLQLGDLLARREPLGFVARGDGEDVFDSGLGCLLGLLKQLVMLLLGVVEGIREESVPLPQADRVAEGLALEQVPGVVTFELKFAGGVSSSASAWRLSVASWSASSAYSRLKLRRSIAMPASRVAILARRSSSPARRDEGLARRRLRTPFGLAVGVEGMLSGCPEEVLRSVVSSRAPTGI